MANKTSKYFKYAIGEIILVVIGILIALQINTWNELRKNKTESIAILNNLKKELKEDLKVITETMSSLQRRKQGSERLYKLIKNGNINTKIDSSSVIKSLMRSGFIYQYNPPFAVYNEVQNSGRLGLIKSDSIKKLLANYRSQTEENIRIEAPYQISIKTFEEKAVRYLSEKPNIKDKQLLERYNLIEFNLEQLSANKELLESLRHISYITAIEIAVKQDFLVPNLEVLIKTIDKELNND